MSKYDEKIDIMFKYFKVMVSFLLCACVYAYADKSKSLCNGMLVIACKGRNVVNSLRPSDSPGRRQAIIWTNAGILLTRTLRSNSGEILSETDTFSLKNAHQNVVCEMAAILSRPQCVISKMKNYIVSIGQHFSFTNTMLLRYQIFVKRIHIS